MNDRQTGDKAFLAAALPNSVAIWLPPQAVSLKCIQSLGELIFVTAFTKSLLV